MGSRSVPVIAAPKQFLLWILRNKQWVTCEIFLCLGSFFVKPSAHSKILVFWEGTFQSWHQSIWPLNLGCQESSREGLSSESKVFDLQLFFSEIHLRLYSPHRRERRYLGMFGNIFHALFSINNLSTQSPHGIREVWQEFPRKHMQAGQWDFLPVQTAQMEWGYLYKHKNMCCSPFYLCCLF